MRNFLILLSLAFILGACNNTTQNAESSTDAKIILTMDEFYANPDEYLDKEVTIKGLVTHVCKHGGQKLFIVGNEDGDPLRIDVGENIPEFDISMEGTEAEFTGMVMLMDEEFIAQANAEHEEHHGEEASEDEGV
ncbi:MAG: hypothetical protein ACP5E3_13265, partial [Bacteroidales bacterium]